MFFLVLFLVKNYFNRFVIIIIALLIFPHNVYALSLKEAITHSISTHPSVLALNKQYESEVLETKVIASNLNFKVQMVNAASATHKQQQDTDPGTKNSGNITRSESDNFSNKLSLNISKTIWDGGQTGYRVSSAEATAQSTLYQRNAKRLSLANNVAMIYLSMYFYSQILEMDADILQDVQSYKAQIVELVESGQGAPSTINNAHAYLNSLKTLNYGNQVAFDKYEVQFIELVGLDPGNLRLPELPTFLADKALNDLMLMAKQAHPSLKVVAETLRSRRMLMKSVVPIYTPIISFRAAVEKYNDIEADNQVTISKYNNDISFLGEISATINLYDGGTTRLTNRKAHRLVEQSAYMQEETLRTIEKDVRTYFIDSKVNAALLEINEQDVEIKKRSFLDVKTSRENGGLSILDELVACIDLYQVNSTLLRGKLKVFLDEYGLLNITGQLFRYLEI